MTSARASRILEGFHLAAAHQIATAIGRHGEDRLLVFREGLRVGPSDQGSRMPASTLPPKNILEHYISCGYLSGLPIVY